MGGQGALRIGFKHPDRFRIVAAIDAALDHHELYGSRTPLDDMYPSREHSRQDTAILHIHPARQPAHIWFACEPSSRWFRGNDRLHEKLGALGVSHFFEIGSAGLKELLRFIGDALTKEQRKLI
jgi:S-formylglutathione hydrolase